MAFERLVFRVHAIQRMFQRRITEDDVRQVLATGEIIGNYPEALSEPPYVGMAWIAGDPCGSRG